jgi:hypothetical protein
MSDEVARKELAKSFAEDLVTELPGGRAVAFLLGVKNALNAQEKDALQEVQRLAHCTHIRVVPQGNIFDTPTHRMSEYLQANGGCAFEYKNVTFWHPEITFSLGFCNGNPIFRAKKGSSAIYRDGAEFGPGPQRRLPCTMCSKYYAPVKGK